MAFAPPVVALARHERDVKTGKIVSKAVAQRQDQRSQNSWNPPGIFRFIWQFARGKMNRDNIVDEVPDNDGLEERLLAREQRERERIREQSIRAAKLLQVPSFTTQNRSKSSTAPAPAADADDVRGGGGGFLFFRRKTQKTIEQVKQEVIQKVPATTSAEFGGLYESQIYDYVAEAIDRKYQQNDGENRAELQTLLPYDLQRALFDELRAKSKSDGVDGSTTVIPAPVKRRRSRPPISSTPTTPIETRKKKIPIPLRWAGAFVSMFRSKKEDNADVQPKASAAAYAEALAHDTEFSSSDDGGLSNGGAAAAYATAAAIATSATPRGQVEADEEKKLLAAVTAARAVDNEQDARVFVETVGVNPLVRAACALSGLSQSAALTALANLAIMLPKSRIDMLDADNGALVRELISIVQGPGAFTPATAAASALAHTEALVSGTHLLGSLALATGKAGREWRLRLMGTDELVRNLQRLSGGMKNGGPEGAARAARRALGALGVNEWKPRVAGQRGLRVLSIDGGGTRAIMAFEMLKHLKRMTGCEIHELFDVIGGTSTGAIVAASLGIAHKTVEEVEALYRDLIGKIFARHPVNGPKLLLTRAYYDTKVLEDTLKRECGSGVFIDSQAEEKMNKVFVVSSVMSRVPQELHVFRNYTYPKGHESRYDGTVEAQLWEALRASSAAPTFFSEIRVHGELHADGAIVANNPTAVAIHEAKSVYPGVPIELVVSIGNGHAPEVGNKESKQKVGWGEVFSSIVESATSTETVHHALVDLFPPDKYFRFNPLTDSTQIDETRPDQLALFVKDSKHYIKVNSKRFDTVAAILRPKTPRNLWKRFREALSKEIQVLRANMEDDIYLPHSKNSHSR